ncbi:DUF6286 domain-containing protein [Nocardia takedensis]|uniref:DUF6286 domain-containing protein n=1 Tax=Nocardia takedensis TaxID=259390 RepID=UPI00030F7EB9|nr:DUF6286 domain-containing protein [Nocardia takedensis]
MIRRPRRVTPAVLVALALLGLSVAVGVSLAQRLLDTSQYLSYDTVATELHARTWSDPLVLIVGIVVAVLGAALLVAALWPGRPAVLPLADGDDLRAGVSRGGLRTALRNAASTVDGVESPRVGVRRKVVTVRGDAWRSDTDGVADQVCSAVNRRVQEIGSPVRRVRARLRAPRLGGES